MDLFDTLIWVEILVKTTFLGTPTLTIPNTIKKNLRRQGLHARVKTKKPLLTKKHQARRYFMGKEV
jgi:hypothetical protein